MYHIRYDNTLQCAVYIGCSPNSACPEGFWWILIEPGGVPAGSARGPRPTHCAVFAILGAYHVLHSHAKWFVFFISARF